MLICVKYFAEQSKRSCHPQNSIQQQWTFLSSRSHRLRSLHENFSDKVFSVLFYTSSSLSLSLSTLYIFPIYESIYRNISPAHVVSREVNDSCRQFVHKHVPVTLPERSLPRCGRKQQQHTKQLPDLRTRSHTCFHPNSFTIFYVPS